VPAAGSASNRVNAPDGASFVVFIFLGEDEVSSVLFSYAEGNITTRFFSE
jgi:hypothetical protein